MYRRHITTPAAIYRTLDNKSLQTKPALAGEQSPSSRGRRYLGNIDMLTALMTRLSLGLGAWRIALSRAFRPLLA